MLNVQSTVFIHVGMEQILLCTSAIGNKCASLKDLTPRGRFQTLDLSLQSPTLPLLANELPVPQ